MEKQVAQAQQTVLTLEAATATCADWKQWWAENQSQFQSGTRSKAEAAAFEPAEPATEQ
ncbi:MAG: hypothetical protein IT209_02475 [Armatimonadetes bacterium]|nr:hypothetical protein [Armatimonadota bacterium]